MAKINKKRKVHTNHAEHRKPAKPPLRKDAAKSKSSKSAAKHPQSKKAGSKTSSSSSTTQHRPTIPFDPGDRILLLGEGDFSFSRSLVAEHGCYDIVATCYDSKAELFAKYTPQAEVHVSYLEGEGQRVLYSVDATKLDKNKELKKMTASFSSSAFASPSKGDVYDDDDDDDAGGGGGGKFTLIIFNFPHVGGKSTDVNRQVRFNQELLVQFFQAAQALLAPHAGKIVVTLFEGEPYTLWNVRDLARHAGLEVVRSFRFDATVYPGYEHRRTLGNIVGGGGWKGEEREARSFVFGLKSRGGEGAKAGGGAKTQAEMQKVMERQRRERLGAGAKEKKRKRDGDEDSSSSEED